MKSRLKHWVVGLVVDVLYGVSKVFRCIFRRRRSRNPENWDVLLTGTFQSAEWIKAFLLPLIGAESCRRVTLVTTFPMDGADGVRVISPPPMLCRLVGKVPARLIAFAWHAVISRPDLVGGFHISINALVAQAVAALVGSRSLYFCVGGPIEVQDGGLWGESRFFGRLDRADSAIEAKLLRAVRNFDAVVVMGRKAAAFYSDNGVSSENIFRITGGVDSSRFVEPRGERKVDVIFVGRLVPIKALELFLATVRELVDGGRAIRARIVGTGPLAENLKLQARELGVENHVEFAGFVPDVVKELQASKCFVLTSRSEGLSLAMIEAMLAGTVPVVANVGDLGDLVTEGVNGELVDSRDPKEFANSITHVINDEDRLASYSRSAYKTALAYNIENLAARWNVLLAALGGESID